jgi:hypothetical protein
LFVFNYRLQQVEDVLEEEKLLDILQDPTRIFSGNKSSSQFCPKAGNVISSKGHKNSNEVNRGHVEHP